MLDAQEQSVPSYGSNEIPLFICENRPREKQPGLKANFVNLHISAFTENLSEILGHPPCYSAHSRVGQPQFLNQDRYDKIRMHFLKLQIAGLVARRIEHSFDTGVHLVCSHNLMLGMGLIVMNSLIWDFRRRLA